MGQSFLVRLPILATLCFQSFLTMTNIELLQLIKDYILNESHPNVDFVFRTFLTMSVTVAQANKEFLRSTMGQERRSNLAILSIENDIGGENSFKGVIGEFATIKSKQLLISILKTL